MNRSRPGLPVHHQLPEFTLNSRPSSQWCHPAIFILCRPLLPLPPIPPSIRVFSNSQLFAWGGQSIGVSASSSVLPKNTQDWSPLEWTGWIPLQSKRLSRVFSNTTVQKHQLHRRNLALSAAAPDLRCEVTPLGRLPSGMGSSRLLPLTSDVGRANVPWYL